MTDFVDALESELRRAAERRARGDGGAWRGWRPSRLLPAAAIAIALGIGLAVVLAVRPTREDAGAPGPSGPAVSTVPSVTGTPPRTVPGATVPPAVGPAPPSATTDATRPADGAAAPPAASPIPADVSPGARHSKRFGLGRREATSAGVPVYADIDRWRYCPRDPLPLGKGDLADAAGAVLAIVGRLTSLETFGARARPALVAGSGYAIHQCGSLMRGRSVDVGVVLPRVTFSASLSQLDLVLARTRAGWVVFDRRH